MAARTTKQPVVKIVERVFIWLTQIYSVYVRVLKRLLRIARLLVPATITLICLCLGGAANGNETLDTNLENLLVDCYE
jgi:hypothetical protein